MKRLPIPTAIALSALLLSRPATGAPPRSLDSRLRIELFAESPAIATPTGIDVDAAGRVWAIESNTHFRPDDYKGHPTDRVLVFKSGNTGSKTGDPVVFTDGLTHAMSLAVQPVWLAHGESSTRHPAPNTQLFVATRADIRLYLDNDGDLKADSHKTLVTLETDGDYPHNGLAGFAFDATGWMYVGLGENLGAKYAVVGSDGSRIEGGGEGGSVFRCRPDGSKLSRFATGYWNPHANCFDAFGRLFTVDNDPDSRPPCRLLHTVEGGDFGYRFRNGRKGLHPYTAWNGELPGTLPMVSGTGEAPSGIIAYESDGWPADYRGDLLVGSWGDHRIDRFRLVPVGASFKSRPEPVIIGDADFRPVGLAVAPNGDVYCTDWVLRDYNLHGQGRIWRITSTERQTSDGNRLPVDVRIIDPSNPVAELADRLRSPRLEVRRTAANALAATDAGRDRALALLGDDKQSVRTRIELLWALSKVPLKTRDFDFLRTKGGPALIAGDQDEVLIAGMRLVGTPQFPLDREKLFGYEREWFTKPAPGEYPPDHAARFRLALIPLMDAGSFETFNFFNLMIDENDPFLNAAIIHAVAEAEDASAAKLLEFAKSSLFGDKRSDEAAPQRTIYLLAARAKNPKDRAFLELGLNDPSPAVQRTAVQWAVEERLQQYRDDVAHMLDQPELTQELFLAVVAGLEILDGKDPADFDRAPPTKYAARFIRDDERSTALRAIALRLLPDGTAVVDEKLLKSLLASDDRTLQIEALRAVQQSKGSVGVLHEFAANEKNSDTLRAEAALALASRPANAKSMDLFSEWLTANSPLLQDEAVRATRTLFVPKDADAATSDRFLTSWIKFTRDVLEQKPSKRRDETAELIASVFTTGNEPLPDALEKLLPNRPTSTDGWVKLLAPNSKRKPSDEPVLRPPGDADAGRRVFFHPAGPACYRCHTVHGRGGKIGPDLSVVARTMNRQKLIESIVDPSREISPQFTPWTVVTTDGKTHTGLILNDGKDRLRLGTPEAKEMEIPTNEIEIRQPSKTSTMPEKLVDRITIGEFGDLLAFLEGLN